MKKLNQRSESDFLRLLFAFFSLALIVGAVVLHDRAEMFRGMWTITSGTVKIATNTFSVGGYAGSFLSAGLVCLACCLLFFLPQAKANAGSVIGFLLTMGFAFWGLNILNMWFGILGVLLYCLVKREAPGKHVNAMLFSTALAPLYSDLLFRYPNATAHGFTWPGLGLAVIVGIVVGFLFPIGLPHSPNMHKGYSIYSAALPVGILSFFLRTILYSLPGANLNDLTVSGSAEEASLLIANVFSIAVFAICILAAFLMGCKPKDYWNLMKDSGHGVDFAQKYGNATFLMNVGVYGMFIMLYYNLIGASFNAVALGCVFCMLASCCSGAHPRNVLPIMVGYVLISALFGAIVGEEFTLGINSQTIVIGLCFANALAPVSGRYGFICGIIAAMLHYCIVSYVPILHGGFLLYNGGFTACIVCMLLIPVLESFLKTKDERNAVKKA